MTKLTLGYYTHRIKFLEEENARLANKYYDLEKYIYTQIEEMPDLDITIPTYDALLKYKLKTSRLTKNLRKLEESDETFNMHKQIVKANKEIVEFTAQIDDLTCEIKKLRKERNQMTALSWALTTCIAVLLYWR